MSRNSVLFSMGWCQVGFTVVEVLIYWSLSSCVVSNHRVCVHSFAEFVAVFSVCQVHSFCLSCNLSRVLSSSPYFFLLWAVFLLSPLTPFCAELEWIVRVGFFWIVLLSYRVNSFLFSEFTNWLMFKFVARVCCLFFFNSWFTTVLELQMF